MKNMKMQRMILEMKKNITAGTCISLQLEYIPTSCGEENTNTFIPGSQSKPFKEKEVGHIKSVVKTAHSADRKECIQKTAKMDGVLMPGTLQDTKVIQEILKNKPNPLLKIGNNEMISSTKIARGSVTQNKASGNVTQNKPDAAELDTIPPLEISEKTCLNEEDKNERCLSNERTLRLISTHSDKNSNR